MSQPSGSFGRSLGLPHGLAQMVSPMTGLVRQVNDFPVSPDDPAVFTSLAMPSDPGRLGTGLNCLPGAGVGLTAASSRASAVGEAVERYSASYVDPRRVVVGSYDALSTRYPLTDPEDYALYHPTQLETLPFAPFDRQACVGWVAGRSLVSGEERWVPAVLAFLPYSQMEEREVPITYATSTGLACGPTWEAACRGGLFEVIERDALMILWRQSLPAPRRSHYENYLPEAVQSRFKRRGLCYTLVDMTTDIGLPCRLCVLEDQTAATPRFLIGAASRSVASEASLEAVLEAAHGLKWMREQTLSEERIPKSPEEVKTFEDHAVLYAFGNRADAFDFLLEAGSDFEDSPHVVEALAASESPLVPLTLCTGEDRWNSAGEEVVYWAGRLSELGYDAIAVDMATPDVRQAGLSVARVVVPGMQLIEGPHAYQYLGGRRLYEVPVKLGYAGAALEPSGLNQDPHPLP